MASGDALLERARAFVAKRTSLSLPIDAEYACFVPKADAFLVHALNPSGDKKSFVEERWLGMGYSRYPAQEVIACFDRSHSIKFAVLMNVSAASCVALDLEGPVAMST